MPLTEPEKAYGEDVAHVAQVGWQVPEGLLGHHLVAAWLVERKCMLGCLPLCPASLLQSRRFAELP